MSRSVKKGPFIQPALLKRVEELNKNGEKKVLVFSKKANTGFTFSSDKKFKKLSDIDKYAMREKGEGQLKDEALRVVRKLSGWEPGVRRGKPVRVKYTVPITFRLR